MTHVNCNSPKNALRWQQCFFSVFTSYVSFHTVTYCYQQSLPRCITCHRCLRSTVTCSKTPIAVNFEPLLPCRCYAIKANFETILPQVSQPASAGRFFWRQIWEIWLFSEALRVKKNCLAFLFNIWLFLEAVGIYPQTGVLAFWMSCWKLLLGFFKPCLVYYLKSYLETHKRTKL